MSKCSPDIILGCGSAQARDEGRERKEENATYGTELPTPNKEQGNEKLIKGEERTCEKFKRSSPEWTVERTEWKQETKVRKGKLKNGK